MRRTPRAATTSAWIWGMIGTTVVRARRSASSLRHVVGGSVLIPALIRGTVGGAITAVKLASSVSLECAITPEESDIIHIAGVLLIILLYEVCDFIKNISIKLSTTFVWWLYSQII